MQQIICVHVPNITKYGKIIKTVLIQLLLNIHASGHNIYQERTVYAPPNSCMYVTHCNRIKKTSSTKNSRKRQKSHNAEQSWNVVPVATDDGNMETDRILKGESIIRGRLRIWK